jgi:hypothetical protein
MLLFVVVASMVSVGRAQPAAAGVVDQQVAVPSYIPPNGDPDAWNRLIGSPSNKAGVIVANVANGPDFVAKGMWSDVMSRAHNSGKRVLGYVDTGYMGLTGQTTRLGSSRSADWIVQIEQDINRWYALYPGLVDGIFFDQGHNLCGDGNYIARLYQFVNQFEKRYHPTAMTVLNPGAVVPQCYEWTADVLLTYESSFEGYMQRAEQPGDLNYHSPDWTPQGDHKIWHIIYGVPEDQIASVIATSRSRNAGYVFVTDDVMVNPYDTLPHGSYWSNELNDVNGVGGYISGPAPRDPNFGPAATPSNLRVDRTDYTSTRISWDYAPGADRYRVYVDGQHIAEVPDDTTSVTIGGLAPNGHSYNISVSAISPNGYSSPPSNNARATTTAMPQDQTVANPHASIGSGTATFSADFLSPYSFHRVFIGSSTPNLTCWKTPLFGRCAVWVIEGHYLLRYTGDATGTQWAWQMVNDHINPSVSGYTYRWDVPISDLGEGTDDITVSGDGYGPLTYVRTDTPDIARPAVLLARAALSAIGNAAAILDPPGYHPPTPADPPPPVITPGDPTGPNPPPPPPPSTDDLLRGGDELVAEIDFLEMFGRCWNDLSIAEQVADQANTHIGALSRCDYQGRLRQYFACLANSHSVMGDAWDKKCHHPLLAQEVPIPEVPLGEVDAEGAIAVPSALSELGPGIEWTTINETDIIGGTADETFYYLAELEADGSVAFDIKTTLFDEGEPVARGPVSASDFIKATLDHFGDAVNRLRGVWVDKATDPSTNRLVFERAFAEGRSPAEAAFETPTGKIAARNGFTHVEFPEGLAGPGQTQRVIFTR